MRRFTDSFAIMAQGYILKNQQFPYIGRRSSVVEQLIRNQFSLPLFSLQINNVILD